ncbi:SseB family protein [Streptomyces sp. AK02-01A]|uniref:SseB family protein n=1 Tax=Streptomyces sp. AK02-01A TaxID=3028648 RepID=UPI0029B64176|nr:SseB family protein [Streptomyces sp. AK02-01A]MDX3853341.1 SseB family protein [Streptomyces sp. AK02-01A]
MSTPTPDEHAPPAEARSTEETQAAADAAERQAAADTQATLTDLANSVALLPQAPPVEGEEERPDGAVALPVIEQDGNRYVPAFTSEDALVAAGGDPGTALGISIVELAENWPEDDLWLAVNPSTDEGLALPSDLVRALPTFSHAGRSGRPGGEGGTR